MKQFNYKISSIKALIGILNSDEITAFHDCESQFIQIYSANTNSEWYQLSGNAIRSVFPSAVIVGATSVGEIIDGKISTESTVVLFSFFESSSISLFSYECLSGEEEKIADTLNKDVESLNTKVQGMLLLSTPISINAGALFNRFTSSGLGYPVFGGGAGDYANKRDSLIYDGFHSFKQGVISVVFSGDNLSVEALTYLGWNPLSEEMTITETDNLSIRTIDNKPAFSVYERFLGIKADDNFFQNCLEFPLLIVRDGQEIARIPFFADKDTGALRLVADVRPGEKFRIGYGNPQIIISESMHIQSKMLDFQPEAIFLYTCLCRRFLMQDEVNLETRPFNIIAPTSGFYTFCEFFANGASRSMLNSTMVAVGFREKAKVKEPLHIDLIQRAIAYHNPDPYANKHTRILSQLLYFINVIIKELEEKNLALGSVNAEKDKYFSILAHDLRGPLSTFVASTQIINEDIMNMELKEIKEITLGMKASAANIYELLENLLEWSTISRGGLDFNPGRYNLKKITKSCFDLFAESAFKKNILITINIDDDIEVLTDIHIFNTVFRNLIINAIKFTPKGGKIDITAVVNSENQVEFKIKDTGIGIPKILINNLFKLSERTNRRGTDGEPSTGLGLLLCKELIKKNNGEILVESEEGKGSIFSFTLPGSRQEEKVSVPIGDKIEE
ncbi:MAG TPA: FIST N-terminal domain-containing protein [Bacteroidales bacterium]|nr:FIST N-terminal domain-containing protein [Bacteroidales bacterium]